MFKWFYNSFKMILYIMNQRWHRNLFWRFRKFRVSDYSFRNLIRNSKPQPKPETSTETRNLNRNPETAKTSIIYLFILSKVGAETLLCQIRKFQASDYNFRNLIQNSKPHPTPETSFETWNLTWTPKTTQTSICCINVLYISFKCTDVCNVFSIYINRIDVCYISP